jgi:hypothetical protein
MTRDETPAAGDPLAGVLQQISGDSILQTVKFLSHQQTRRIASRRTGVTSRPGRTTTRAGLPFFCEE